MVYCEKRQQETETRLKLGTVEKKNDFSDRLFDFSADVLEMLKKPDRSETSLLLRYQLGRSATSSGANYEESQTGISCADF